jgi:hypothetical protein
MEKIEINKLELASELAHEKLMNEWSNSIKIYENETDSVTNYTEEAQEIFNQFYDEYLILIESCKTN